MPRRPGAWGRAKTSVIAKQTIRNAFNAYRNATSRGAKALHLMICLTYQTVVTGVIETRGRAHGPHPSSIDPCSHTPHTATLDSLSHQNHMTLVYFLLATVEFDAFHHAPPAHTSRIFFRPAFSSGRPAHRAAKRRSLRSRRCAHPNRAPHRGDTARLVHTVHTRSLHTPHDGA